MDGDCRFWIGVFIIAMILNTLNQLKVSKLKANYSQAACLEEYGTDSISKSIEPARKVHHKKDKPNQITITCGDK